MSAGVGQLLKELEKQGEPVAKGLNPEGERPACVGRRSMPCQVLPRHAVPPCWPCCSRRRPASTHEGGRRDQEDGGGGRRRPRVSAPRDVGTFVVGHVAFEDLSICCRFFSSHVCRAGSKHAAEGAATEGSAPKRSRTADGAATVGGMVVVEPPPAEPPQASLHGVWRKPAAPRPLPLP